MRIIFHIDVNSAFLSWTAVKLLKEGYHEDIRNIFSAIAGNEEERHGIILAKSLLAQRKGIKTGETLYEARKKCPYLKTFLPDYEYYKECSDSLYNLLLCYLPEEDIERYSIDECFMDMSKTKYLYDDLENLAYKIKDEIKNKLGFTVNVGIGNNKLLAKMASDMEKPDKVHTLYREEIETKMWPLAVDDLFMVGRETAKKLRELNIKTIKDLSETPKVFLIKHFKSYGEILYNYAWGIDNSLVKGREEVDKSISTTHTLKEDTNSLKVLKKELLDSAIKVGRKLRENKEYAKVITLIIRTNDFKDMTKQKTLINPLSSDREIYKEALSLLLLIDKSILIRNIGIRLSKFQKEKSEQLSLFDKPRDEKEDKLQEVVDKINKSRGKEIVKSASLIETFKEE